MQQLRIIIILLVSIALAKALALSNETDCLSLLAIKSQLHDPLGVTSSWNRSACVNLCQHWTGVACGHRNQRVTKLDLRNQSIGGILSPYVGNLSFLRYINIADNDFHGEIPDGIGNLFRLETLVLANNSFSGRIPTNLSHCSKLITFSAHRNNLVGEIPEELISRRLFNLQGLSVGDNQLTGQLPASIGNLSALRVIDIRTNRLWGKIPITLSQLTSLAYLHVGDNHFSGTIPPSVYNISSLVEIYLYGNRFTGSLPIEIGKNLPNLRNFVIYTNNFTGSLPDSFSNASNLEVLHLAENQFRGQVSINFNGLKDLSMLGLATNFLGNGAANDLDFVDLLTNCTKLQYLYLADNGFGGVLPHSIANLSTALIDFNLGKTQIYGTIPPGIANLVNLNSLRMEANRLTGTIPHVIGELKNLQLLHLHANFLQGTIPSSLGNLTLLTYLSFGANNLQGNIPFSLGNCKNLMFFFAPRNKLTGALPQQILEITTLSLSLDLSDNLLNGSLPLGVGNLKSLVRLGIARNQFSGQIPVTLGACTSLEYVELQGNSFSGTIPQSLSSLTSIKELDLSQNNFSGQIPKYLENLSFLQYLNLSYNHFEGEVPTKGIFKNKTGFSIVGNGKLCGGLDELHLPSCQARGSRKPNVNLVKVVIPVIGGSCLILSVCIFIFYARRRRSAHKSSNTSQMEQQFPMVSYKELSKATNEFSSSNTIGRGSFGFVYKGVLHENGMLVAVKVINLEQKGGSKSFAAECEALRSIRHRNLIKIVTICSSIDFKGVDFKALVYEYMQNGSLEEWLHQRDDQLGICNLSLIQRLNIVIDVASAVEYLHHHCQPPIVHGDLKPSNVLLDHDMVAHVSDFGLAKFLSASPLGNVVETPSSSIGVKGTIGYVAPEYGLGGEASIRGDVYSFGILLLEIFTRRRPTESMFNEGLTLHEFAKRALPEKVMEIVDPSLLPLEEERANSRRVRNEECLVAVIKTGVACSIESPFDRMEMTDVVVKLCHARQNFLGQRI
ncbi:putative receptor-like protein kinase [Citrus sinensis]|uniref:Receptor-like protein kinase n=2 Tax=Citrus sinensis TaxID=2711 RepID=A0ACB8II17_CITSI|nr:putative receptor-like protein kinase [Citrus sinensis]